MQQIKNNPFRTVGLLVGATAREKEKQIKRLKQFIEAEQDPQDDFSFPTLGNLTRTVDSVADAASKLNLDGDKMNAAVFWFFKGNSVTDEPAFDALKESNQQISTDIWTKLISTGEVTQKNQSAFQNFSTLLLCNAFNDSKCNPKLLEYGVTLKLKFLESDFVKDFKALATDETYRITKNDLQLMFLNQVQLEIENSGGITSTKFLEILNKQEFIAKDQFLMGFTQKPINLIEKYIEESKSKRKANKANAIIIGKELYEKTLESLWLLKSILGITNMKFTSVSDKVSMEILQCGIDYFSHYKDTNTDPGSASMDLFSKAMNLAIGNIAKQRCQENTDNLKEWIDERPERIKQQKIINDLEKLKDLIDKNERLSDTIANAKQFLSNARVYLYNIKNTLGINDELYLGLSSRIASDAQSMLVAEINQLQERLSSAYDNATKLATILILKQKVNEAYEVTETIGRMDLRQDFRIRYNNNRNSLSNIKSQLSNVNTGSSGSSSNSNSDWCYIATMAYGDYDHPQVIVLRQFRDDVLKKTVLGKWFIRAYYHYSPKLVTKLKNKKIINSIIRKTLDQFIKFINK